MRFHLIMVPIWLCVGVGFVVAHYSGFERFGMDRERTLLVGMFALILAAYNAVRWWAARANAKSRAQSSPPPRKRSLEDRPRDYNPALDFTREEPPPE